MADRTEFDFRNLPPGEYYVTLMAHPEGHEDDPRLFTRRSIASRKVKVTAGETIEVRLTAEDRVKQPVP